MTVREEETTDFQTSYALSMIICDAVHLDPGTGKAFILGCFGSIAATAFPATHPEMAVFAEVTDCRGLTPFMVRIVDVDERSEPIAEARAEIDVPDPLAVAILVLRLNGLVFPGPGEYRIQLFSGNTHLMERGLILSRVQGSQ
jgi:hypothetical protein